MGLRAALADEVRAPGSEHATFSLPSSGSNPAAHSAPSIPAALGGALISLVCTRDCQCRALSLLIGRRSVDTFRADDALAPARPALLLLLPLRGRLPTAVFTAPAPLQEATSGGKTCMADESGITAACTFDLRTARLPLGVIGRCCAIIPLSSPLRVFRLSCFPHKPQVKLEKRGERGQPNDKAVECKGEARASERRCSLKAVVNWVSWCAGSRSEASRRANAQGARLRLLRREGWVDKRRWACMRTGSSLRTCSCPSLRTRSY